MNIFQPYQTLLHWLEKSIKRSELAHELDKTDMTIHRAIKKLIEFNMIRRVGPNKTGYWEVIK